MGFEGEGVVVPRLQCDISYFDISITCVGIFHLKLVIDIITNIIERIRYGC
jgi:hypothetical protein